MLNNSPQTAFLNSDQCRLLDPQGVIFSQHSSHVLPLEVLAEKKREGKGEVDSLVQDGLSRPSIPITTSPVWVLPLLLLLPHIPSNPLHCSVVKSTSRRAHYLPPSAAFITKFMMKQFCIPFLRWSRYQGQTCSKGTEYTGDYCIIKTSRTLCFSFCGFQTRKTRVQRGLGDDEGQCGTGIY